MHPFKTVLVVVLALLAVGLAGGGVAWLSHQSLFAAGGKVSSANAASSSNVATSDRGPGMEGLAASNVAADTVPDSGFSSRNAQNSKEVGSSSGLGTGYDSLSFSSGTSQETVLSSQGNSVEVVERGAGPGADAFWDSLAQTSSNPNQSLAPSPLAGVPMAARNLDINVPFGARIPAVFFDDTPRPAPQQAALDRIMDEFQNAVGAASRSLVSESSNGDDATSGVTTDIEAWEEARKIADRRYQILYGDAAYNQLTMSAAMQALEEKRELESGGVSQVR